MDKRTKAEPGSAHARDAMLRLLSEGSATCRELAERSGLSRSSAKAALTRLRIARGVYTLGGTWVLGREPDGVRDRWREERHRERRQAALDKKRAKREQRRKAREESGESLQGTYLWHGQRVRIDEAMRLSGLKKNTIYSRAAKRIPLDLPLRYKSPGEKKPSKRSGLATTVGLFDDSLRYEEDLRAQAVLGYLRAGEPLMTEDEILALLNSPEELAKQRKVLDAELGRGRGDARCSRAEARALRRCLQHEMRLERQGAYATLDEISEFLEVTRERVRQIELEARESFEKSVGRLKLKERVVADLKLADELRRETHAQRAENMGSSDGGGLSVWNEKNTMAGIAKRSGKSFDPKAPINIRKAS